jgi:hypothetical protein
MFEAVCWLLTLSCVVLAQFIWPFMAGLSILWAILWLLWRGFKSL